MNSNDDKSVIEEIPIIENSPYNDVVVNRKKLQFKIIAIYIGLTLLISVFMIGYGKYRFPNPEQTIDKIVLTEDFYTSVSLNSSNQDYPYLLNINGVFQNQNDEEIPSAYLEITLYDDSGNSIGVYTYTVENFASMDIWTVHESIPMVSETYTMTKAIGIDETSSFYLLLNFMQVFLTALIFLVLDKSGFKLDWFRFKSKFTTNMGQIFVGIVFVYAAMYTAQLILDGLNVSGVSENESTIASMFSADPTTLILMFLLLVVFTPIVEEMVFRKGLYGFIDLKWGPIPAILISGLIFGLMHVVAYADFIQAIPYVAMGMVFGFIYYRSEKNIFVSIGVHALNNFIAYASYVFLLFFY